MQEIVQKLLETKRQRRLETLMESRSKLKTILNEAVDYEVVATMLAEGDLEGAAVYVADNIDDDVDPETFINELIPVLTAKVESEEVAQALATSLVDVLSEAALIDTDADLEILSEGSGKYRCDECGKVFEGNDGVCPECGFDECKEIIENEELEDEDEEDYESDEDEDDEEDLEEKKRKKRC